MKNNNTVMHEDPSAGCVNITEESIATKFTVYINGTIGSPQDFLEAVHALERVGLNDQVVLHINSEGGRIDGAVELLAAMQSCPVQTHARTTALCMSAATLPLLYADTFEIGDHCNFMIHNYSSAVSGSGSSMMNRVSATQDWVHTLMEELYSPLLTPEELDQVFKHDKELYFTGAQLKERIAQSPLYAEKLINK